eukprot:TRINITY_DN15583_c0_g1_i1.p1 TRINITY_DN15583_c0_g1~~TRINITY_DN15583_c0_g1_i1.p1  ORF type:complete len:446 (+),score=109.63 TRINITY_DN15583_c0_g1_i1:999-2336(+)
MVLNEALTPVTCQVHWIVNPVEKTFSGSCTWQVSINSPCDVVRCHAQGLELDAIKVAQYKKPQKLENIDRAEDGLLSLKVCEKMQEGRAEISFSFRGSIKGTVGVHFSGLESKVVQTHFEVSHGRKAFPCFDIPSIRATYKVSVTVLNSSSATTILSCMPAVCTRTKGTDLTVEFGVTPPIPVYVLSFITFPYEITTLSQEVTLPSGTVVPITASITPNPKYPLELLLKATAYGLATCSEWTGVEFPLPKLDVVVVPKLCLGGMENHGLVFIDGAETTPGKGKKVGNDSTIELLMHEIAHMWMGNMVGLEFWVKEGLAQFFEKTLTDGFLGRSCSLPTDTKFSSGPVEIEKKNKPKPKPKAKGKAKKGKGKAEEVVEEKKETDAIDHHDVFNGSMYTKSFLWVVGVERALGRQEFLKRLSDMLNANMDQYIPEELFMEVFGGEKF